jgi:riboflavin biosynthesis pyrimidine reductase
MVNNPKNPAEKLPLSMNYPVFNTPDLAAMVITTQEGARALEGLVGSHPNVTLLIIENKEHFEQELLVKLLEQFRIRYLLVEGGPTVNGAFHAQGLVTDDFLTLAPGMAGRVRDSRRGTLMMGYEFPPNAIPMPRLISVRRSDDHLLIRERYR